MKVRIVLLLLVGAWTLAASQSAVKAQGPKSVNDGVFTADQAKRGGGTYQAECSSCHGGDLGGDGFAPPLSGAEFAANWNDLSVGDLYERIRISMPPNGPSKVTNQQKADIIAFLLDANKYPAGQAELMAQADALKQIKIEMKK